MKPIINQSTDSKTNMLQRRKWLPWVILFWLLVWQFASMQIENHILFASPLETIQAFFQLIQTEAFWISVFSSFYKIALGFFLAVVVGTLLATFAAASKILRLFLSVPIQFIKTIPVVSFIILALFWIPSKYLSVLISFLMVLPVLYTNVQKGIDQTNRQLLEMAYVYHIGFLRTLRYIYLPAVFPFFLSACSIGLGFCFKSGIAAEVIGLPSHSIGEALYEAKLYLLTKELFAWTLVIICISVCFEKCIIFLLQKIQQCLQNSAVVTKHTSQSTHQIPPRKSVYAPADKPFLCLEHIYKHFDRQLVLHNFSLCINPTERIACMGASGVGKTTVSRLLLGLLTPDTGTISRTEPLQISAVFQENRLCPEPDAVTNVLFTAFPNAKTKQEKQHAVAQIKDLFAQMELTDYEGKHTCELSGGMQRRVALARALLSDSNILLLDEPFKGLDQTLKLKIMQLTKDRLQDRALFLITHDESEAAFFDCSIITLESPQTSVTETHL